MVRRQQLREPFAVGRRGEPISERTLHKISVLTIPYFRKIAMLVTYSWKRGGKWEINCSSQDFHLVK